MKLHVSLGDNLHQLATAKVEFDSLVNIGGLWSTANYESSNYIMKLIILQGLDSNLMQKQEIELCETNWTACSLIIFF